MESPVVRIALIDDYDILQAGLRSMLLAYADRLAVVQVVSGASETDPVDIALYDPHSRGKEAMRALLKPRGVHLNKVVLYTWTTSPALVEAAKEAGVDGLLPKTLSADELATKLLQIASGKRVFAYPGGPAAGLRKGLETVVPSSVHHHRLSMREAQMISLISQGFANAEIAELTSLSANSVKSYIRSAYRKIGVQNRSQAVAWGIRNDLAPDRSRQLWPPGANRLTSLR